MKGALLLLVLVPTRSGQDPCRAVPDPLRRIDCYADRSGAEPRPVWRLGEETDPITDRTSVVLRRRANEPFEGPSGRLLRPALTLVCWQGREILLSLEAGEPLAPGGGEGSAEVGLTVRIGTGTPARRAWMASGPDRDAAWLDRHAGALILARALSEEDSGEALFRYRTATGVTRTTRFGLEGLDDLLPRLERACGAG